MEVNENNMTNKEAAEILRRMLDVFVANLGRGNGKTRAFLRRVEAFAKAIDLLERTPD